MRLRSAGLADPGSLARATETHRSQDLMRLIVSRGLELANCLAISTRSFQRNERRTTAVNGIAVITREARTLSCRNT
jgi:hypothetical protein